MYTQTQRVCCLFVDFLAICMFESMHRVNDIVVHFISKLLHWTKCEIRLDFKYPHTWIIHILLCIEYSMIFVFPSLSLNLDVSMQFYEFQHVTYPSVFLSFSFLFFGIQNVRQKQMDEMNEKKYRKELCFFTRFWGFVSIFSYTFALFSHYFFYYEHAIDEERIQTQC